MRKKSEHWKPKVKMMSSKTGEGLEQVQDNMNAFRSVMMETGEMERKRANQRKKWMWSYINNRLIEVGQRQMEVKCLLGSFSCKIWN